MYFLKLNVVEVVDDSLLLLFCSEFHRLHFNRKVMKVIPLFHPFNLNFNMLFGLCV